MSDIGRLIHTTKQVCSDCNKGKLQLRARKNSILVKGENLDEEEKYLYCPVCENEEEYKDKKQDKNKHREIKPVVEVKEVKNYGRYKERATTKGGFNRGIGRGNK